MAVDVDVEVAVVGGGPAGSALGALCARSGLRVRLFERKGFPRFQIGESLVPAVNLTLGSLGVLEAMDTRRFPRKHGVQFYSPKGPGRPFYFSEVQDPRMHHTWQVLRSEFDALLLDTARQAGVDARVGEEVVGVDEAGGAVTGVRVRRGSDAEEFVRARVVVDASGQKGILARSHGRRAHIDGLQNISYYAHYRGVQRDTGIDAGSTLIFRLDASSWIWFIPLPDVVSIGLVVPARRVPSLETPQEALEAAIASCPPLRDRLRDAERTMEVRAVRDFSYRATRDGGPGWLLVGDALGFIDPIYSTGLFLGMHSAELAAEALCRELSSGGSTPDLAGFSADYQAGFDRFLVLVRAFYTPDFQFGRLARIPEHRQGLVDLLTGLVSTPEAIGVVRAIREAASRVA